MKATVHIVDDDAAVRHGLTQVLEASGLQVQTYANGEDFLASPPNADGQACVLLDVAMPGKSGIDVHRALLAAGNRLPVLFLTGHGDIPTAVRAVQDGAFDFLEKPIEGKQLIARLERALTQSVQQSQKQAQIDVIKARHTAMSKRERQVMSLVASGMTSKEIGAELEISPRTVDVHRANIMRKMSAGSLAELVNMALVCQQAN